MNRRDAILGELATCPPESIFWASLGYALAQEDHEAFRAGYRAAEADMARAWSRAARRIRSVLQMPTRADLQRRRGEAA